MKQKNLITSLHIKKGLFHPVDFGKSGHLELLNETTAEEKRKDRNMKRKRKGDKELIMTHSESGQESKRRQITLWSGKSREVINNIYIPWGISQEEKQFIMKGSIIKNLGQDSLGAINSWTCSGIPEHPLLVASPHLTQNFMLQAQS